MRECRDSLLACNWIRPTESAITSAAAIRVGYKRCSRTYQLAGCGIDRRLPRSIRHRIFGVDWFSDAVCSGDRGVAEHEIIEPILSYNLIDVAIGSRWVTEWYSSDGRARWPGSACGRRHDSTE
jgi:hypothetical protein